MNKILWYCLAALPLHHLLLTSVYGFRVHPITGKYAFHSGVDLRARRDTVYAVLDGVVTDAGYDRLSGIYIRLDHGDFQSSYGHLSQILVIPGDSVAAGDVIAISGSTGRSTGEHLHFSVAFHHISIDPLKFLLDIQKLNQQHKEIKQ
ncbi:M23 family metallopeptidase [Mucilaginibacter gotjawali]|uniref:Murein DD-endopeptidase MepM n=2 Tax=Mucilaginibacter gotjawali TaxID=1550579 RepID=A0A0X8X4S4_9SPHI|nr:M23 family metallopeptidase [Mucilaginibacter gotjawali]MBB3058756.1 murein DD-endopeptidase MepM/ murein hydrolase activator NlpD [Mucilaginibacter gotjawali]BAU55641.1 Murein DD-endopeptidase MepM [Mucilaginibacter gotjawali]